MLLVHQAGSVKVGEVVRYTLTYTPSQDRILPSPKHLHLKIKNTSAIPLRAAYLHGPYTLHVSAYPSTFNPNKKVEDPKRYGVPDFEPLLKAGGHWTSELTVPEDIRETGASFAHGRKSQEVRRSEEGRHGGQEESKSVTWIIEIASQILFSNSAVVHFEVLVGRDERSLDLGFAAVAGHGHGTPGNVGDHKVRDEKIRGQHANTRKGVYSRAVKLVCEDTEALWDKPSLPKPSDIHNGQRRGDRQSEEKPKSEGAGEKSEAKPMKKKKIHLVVVTHGLHSNIGADMLYLKESIDATVKQARLDARKRKAAYKAKQRQAATGKSAESTSDSKTSDNPDGATTAPLTGGQEELQDNDDDGSDDEEQTIVRGFTGNAVRTERGIQYLGKRLAKYILHFTYPDQPFLPVKKSMTRSFADSFKSTSTKEARDGLPAHSGSSIHVGQEQHIQKEDLAYTFTSISFVGHSLGGLVQTYAIAYIQKHAPHFFTQIQPINFICLASPLLGLSNENPMYVKFALDFGLVGRTGQDLGLTWRAPTLAKSGWTNLVNGFSSSQNKEKEKEADPGAKPLLRILPTGPAHIVLRMFRNRTVYANVVNDGIVPLRTSCLLFLDWRGLGKVEKARRENGLISTMAEWGWAELTGANALSKSAKYGDINLDPDENEDESGSGTNTPTPRGQGDTVPQPAEEATTDDNKNSNRSASPAAEPDRRQFLKNQDHAAISPGTSRRSSLTTSNESSGGILDSFMNLIRPKKSQSSKVTRAIRRGQTMSPSPSGSISDQSQRDRKSGEHGQADRRSLISRGSTDNPTMLHPHSAHMKEEGHKQRPTVSRGLSTDNDPLAPPRTSIFESASDILHPPIPSTSWIIDPGSRTRTIFHDRIYHPEDIPPPPTRRPTLGRSFSGLAGRSFSSDSISLMSSHSKDKNGTPAGSPALPSISVESSKDSPGSPEIGSMKVEEKIARAYHKDLSWRKVLVRLEPDAHNNMIVRRMFANAYGWPVIKHLCDTHFADTWTARARDEDESAWDRAQGLKADEHVGNDGEEVKGQMDKDPPPRTQSESREERDELGALQEVGTGINRHRTLQPLKEGSVAGSVGSAAWDDVYFEGGSDDEEDEDDTYGSRFQKLVGNWGLGAGGRQSGDPASSSSPSSASPAPSTVPNAPPAKKKTPSQDRISHIRTGSSGSHAQPVLSSDMASGSFIPSPSASQHTLTPQTSAKKSQKLVEEPEPLSDNEAVDPGNLTPAASGPGMVPAEETKAEGSSLGGGAGGGVHHSGSIIPAPEPEWKDGGRHGSVDVQVGLGKSVQELLSPRPGSSSTTSEGKGDMLARLSSGHSGAGGAGEGSGKNEEEKAKEVE